MITYRLEITVHNVQGVHVPESIDDLPDLEISVIVDW